MVSEAMAYGCSAIGNAIEANVLATVAIMIGGNEDKKRKYQGRLIEEPIVAAYAVTEPGAGSDVSSIQTRAEKKGDQWVLNGQKMWISNGG